MKNCTKCNKSKEDECFIGCGGRPCKTCDRCRANVKNSMNKNKCEHGKRPHYCKDCGGSEICEHKRQRNHCKLCNDPYDVTVKRMMAASKQHDKHHNRYYDLTYDHVSTILHETTHCPYCMTTLHVMDLSPDLASIERIDNTKGHTDDNTIICCWKCNVRRVGNTVITG